MKRLLVAMAAVLVLGSSTAAHALAPSPAQVFPTFKATVVDPYASCVGIGAAPGPALNYPNTEPEPWLATNPARHRNLIGATQQDRWSDGGGKGLTAAFTIDNGNRWQNRALPFSSCAARYYTARPCPIQPAPASFTSCTLPYERASDPWVDIGPDGTAYTVSISFNGSGNDNAVGAAASADGGNSWARATEIQHDVNADPTVPFNDKESVTADPLHPGTAYAVWDRLKLVACGPSGAGPNRPHSDDHAWAGAKHLAPAGGGKALAKGAAQPLDCFDGPSTFSRTTDGGRTWSTPTPIVTNQPNEQTIGNVIVVDRQTGRLYDTYTYFDPAGNLTVEDVFSDDRGLTWSPRQTINTLGAVGISDPATGEAARTGDITPEPAIDPRTGQLYVAWQDGRFNPNGQDDVVIASSPPNAGTTGTWSTPTVVDLPQDRAGFTPAIKVNGQGQVAVDYYSMRPPITDPAVWPIERYIRISKARPAASPPTTQLTFDDPIKEGGPFNMRAAPNAGGFFVGDYEGMAVDYRSPAFHTFFAMTNCNTTTCTALATTDGSTPPALTYDPMDVYSSTAFDLGF